MPMHTVDTRISHMRCLQQLGWLTMDTTHMGEPDGYLLTPCCIHGYRAVYGPRPKLDASRASAGSTSDPWSAPNSGSGTGDLEDTWNWQDAAGGDQAAYFVREQKLGNEGSWVLVAGARLGDDGMPFDAQAKWWVTTQSDANTLEEELVTEGDQAYNLGFETGQGGGDYLGREVRWRRGDGYSNFGSTNSLLRRWTKDNRASGAAGLGSVRNEDFHGGGIYQAGSGIQDPGLGEASGLPSLGGTNRSSDSFSQDSVWWVLYGNRPFLGITKCGDPIGQAQERDDHFSHGDGSNWRGLGLPEFDVNAVISPTSSSRGGYTPNIIFYGGDIQGAHGQAICSDDGTVTGVNMIDPGATVISDAETNTFESPQVTISMPNHYNAFNAKSTVSTDADEIKAVYPDMFKSATEMQAQLCDGYNDPIAQTFMVNPDAHPHGIFVPKIDICFQSKPKYGDNLPVYLEIRPTVNGFPHADKLIQYVMKRPENVNVSTGFDRSSSPINGMDDPMEISRVGIEQTSGSVYPTFDDTDSEGNPNTSVTTFEFNSPVYLEPGEYAIVIRSNDSAYRCWISDTTSEIVGSSGSLARFEDDGFENVSASNLKQFGGVFFRSSNGRTWEPNQYQDLMFRVHQCDFAGSRFSAATGTFTLGANQINNLSDFEYHRIGIDNFTSIKPTTTKIEGTLKTRKLADTEVSVVSSQAGALFGQNEVGIVRDLDDVMEYTEKPSGQSDIKFDVTLSSNHPDVSPVLSTRGFYATLLQNQINAGGLDVDSIKLKNGGGGYAVDDVFTVSGGGSTTPCTFKVTNVNASGTIHNGGIEIVTAGVNFHREADEFGQDGITLTDNSSAGTGAEFEILSETGSAGGNAKMRYVTKAVHLAPGMSARALRVFLTARSPLDSNIYVYYKVRAAEDSENLNSHKWKLMNRTSPDEDFFQADAPNLAVKSKGSSIEYQFDTDEIINYSNIAGTETYDSFNTFAIKIVGMAGNSAKVPTIDDFRAIAVF